MKTVLYFSLLFLISCSTPTDSDEDIDCLGIVDGTAILDACGICQGDGLNVNNFGSCDCLLDGDVYADCQGMCGGSAIEDCTGECNGSAVKDCTGECSGTAILDACGVCQGDGLNVNSFGSCDCNIYGDVYADCQGICGGMLMLDNCGVCDDDLSNDCHVNNYQVGHKLHIEHQNLEFEYCYPSSLSGENNKFTFSDYPGKIFMIEMSASW